MADENWQQIRRIFDDALRQSAEDRGKFVRQACGADTALLAEVESLLCSLEGAESFLETPAVAKVADLFEAKKLRRGKRLGHYEIIEQIGTGGMGEVYLAIDKKLERRVAVKFLNQKFSRDESNLGRFIREAKTASALNHPNILVIHEIGEADGTNYIVSEFINGRTLREILQQSAPDLPDIIAITIQIASALSAAHEAHLVHRDIKPENVMVRPDGLVKVLDFGLAKLVSQDNKSVLGFDESPLVQNQTAMGMILGTVQYMSPEQAKGEPVDERTDIFSLGALLYEMLTGRTPFAGETASETFANLINMEPPPLENFVSNLPTKLHHITSRMLRKKRDERYQTMPELLADLKDLKENLTVAEKLELTAAPVAARTNEVLQITGDTGKNTFETRNSSFRKAANRKRLVLLTAFIALSAGAIGFYLYWNVRILDLSTKDLSQDFYLQGKFYAVKENRADNDKAIQLLEKAVTLDPNHALAHTELARAYGTRFFQLEPQHRQWQEKAYVALDKAFAINPDLAEAHEIRGFLLWMPANRFPHEQAIAAYRRAAALNPNLDEPHQALGKIYLHIGLLDEARTELRRALELNPGNTMARYRIGIVLIHQGKYVEALRHLKSTPPDINPAIVGRDTVWLLISLGQREEAAALLAELIEKNPVDEGGQFASFKALLSAMAGNDRQAEREIREALDKGRGFGHFHHAAYIIACAYAALNRPEEAIRFLQMTADEGYPCYPLFATDAKLDAIRPNPKFRAFLETQKRQWEYYKSLPKS